MPKNSKAKRRAIDKILTTIGAVAVIVLVVIGCMAWWAYSFTATSVRTELAAQKIYFPAKGSAKLANPKIGPYLNQYAGRQLLTGSEAKAYADHLIAVDLSEIGGGQTYAQISSEAQASPNNTKLKAESQTLFQGETLRGLLLNAYAFGTIGNIARVSAIFCFVAAAVMLLLVLLGLAHIIAA